jgi:SAM-dependent methyltransferase
MRGLIAVNGAVVLLGLGSSYLLLQVYGITGVGIGWLITQTAVAAGIGVILVYPRLRKSFSSESGKVNPMASQTQVEGIPNHIRQHYEVEKRLANRLRQATSKPERLKLYGEVYDELYKEFSYLKEHREKTTPWQVDLIRRFVKPTDAFLEVGAGNCEVSIGAAALTRQAYAVDVSQVFMKKEGWPQNLQFVLSDGSSIPVEAASIDLAYSHQVMEHLHADDGLDQLKHIYQALKKNGRYICITPNRLCGPHDISRYFDEVATGFHLKEYTLAEQHALLKQVGFKQVQAFVSYHGLMLSPILPIQPFLWVERVLERLPYAWRKKAWWLLIAVKPIATK